MIDHLSPREERELRGAAEAGAPWPLVILRCFVEGTRLLLGWDASRTESGIAASLRASGTGAAGVDAAGAIAEAARWCMAHGLHLMSFAGPGPGEDPVGERRWFLAAG